MGLGLEAGDAVLEQGLCGCKLQSVESLSFNLSDSASGLGVEEILLEQELGDGDRLTITFDQSVCFKSIPISVSVCPIR